MKVILLSGKAQSGKDTFYSIAKEFINCKRMAFADELKRIAKDEFYWDGLKDERGRQLLINLGTTTGRAYDGDIWVRKLIDRLERENSEVVIVTDCRFPNEIELIKPKFDAVAVRIERPGYNNGLTQEQLQDTSECALDDYCWDYVVENNGNLDDYRSSVELILKEVYDAQSLLESSLSEQSAE